MSDIETRNAAATKQALVEQNQKLQEMHAKVDGLTNLVKTLLNRFDLLDIQRRKELIERGTGPTVNGSDD